MRKALPIQNILPIHKLQIVHLVKDLYGKGKEDWFMPDEYATEFYERRTNVVEEIITDKFAVNQ